MLNLRAIFGIWRGATIEHIPNEYVIEERQTPEPKSDSRQRVAILQPTVRVIPNYYFRIVQMEAVFEG